MKLDPDTPPRIAGIGAPHSRQAAISDLVAKGHLAMKRSSVHEPERIRSVATGSARPRLRIVAGLDLD